MYKGIGPNKLGSPFKQTTKTYPDLPKALKSDATKSDYKQYSNAKKSVDQHNSMFSNLQKEVKTDSKGHYVGSAAYPERPIQVDNTIETSVIGGAALKGAFASGKPAFNIMKSKPSAWKGAAATIGGMFGDDAVIGGAQYVAKEISNNNNKKNKK
jgi:hypothetical protein